jgi:hypothetical protein
MRDMFSSGNDWRRRGLKQALRRRPSDLPIQKQSPLRQLVRIQPKYVRLPHVLPRLIEKKPIYDPGSWIRLHLSPKPTMTPSAQP